MRKKINSVAIVGGGVSGISLGILLSKRGIHVTIYEKTSKKFQQKEDDRSANFVLTTRGLALLDKIGVRKEVLAESIELGYRVIHGRNGLKIDQPYGTDPLDHPWAIRRSDLLKILQDKGEDVDNLKINYNHRVITIDKKNLSIKTCHTRKGDLQESSSDLIIGADGAFSVVRDQMTKGALIDVSKTYFDWVYKKLIFSPEEVDALNLDRKGLHVWTRQEGILFGLPNHDGTIACIFCAKFDRHLELGTEDSHRYFQSLFLKTFPQFTSCYYLLNSLFQAKISGLINIEMSHYNYHDKIVLVGDSCHALFPFYGQGVNAALEDCLMLDKILESHKLTICAEDLGYYSSVRKKNADALQTLSTQHFYSLRDKADSPLFEIKLWTSSLLEKVFRKAWKNEYSLVVRGNTSYSEAIKTIRRQNLLKKIFLIELLEYLAYPINFIRRLVLKIQVEKKG